MFVFRKGPYNSYAEYELPRPQLLTRKRLRADFGRFGRIDVRYERDRHVDPCDGRPNDGTFRGTIEFHGEGGYVDISERKSRGSSGSGSFVCGVGDERPAPFRRLRGGPKPSGPALLSCIPESGILYLVDSALSRRPNHFAYKVERTKRLRIQRSVALSGARRTFVAEPDLSAATVAPAEPFAGTATFADDRLTGDLAVDFVGVESPVPLAPARAELFDRESELFPTCLRVLR